MVPGVQQQGAPGPPAAIDGRLATARPGGHLVDGEAGRAHVGEDREGGVEDGFVGPGVAGAPGPTENGLVPHDQQIAGLGGRGVPLDVGHRGSGSGAGAARRWPSPAAPAGVLVR
jgi:hypothetical protein